MMYWILLVLGVAIWWAAHLFKRVAPERRADDGKPGRLLRRRRPSHHQNAKFRKRGKKQLFNKSSACALRGGTCCASAP